MHFDILVFMYSTNDDKQIRWEKKITLQEIYEL